MSIASENKFEKVELINKVIDSISEFIMNDKEICEDYEEYLRTMGGNNIATAIPYIFERNLNSKSIPELYLEKNKKITKEEKTILNSFKESFSSVFEIKRISKNKFELFNIINEKMYTVISPIKMTAFRGLGSGYYIVVSFFNYENENYMVELMGVYPPSKKNMAYKYAISKIIGEPELVYRDNDEIKKRIENRAKFSYKRFNELFKTDELTTSNRCADDLIEYLNGSIEDLDWKSKIEDIEAKKYFDVSAVSSSTLFGNGGFSSYPKPFDITLIVDEEWGFYALPFYKTFCSLFEGKKVENTDRMIEYFLTTKAVSQNILKRIQAKYPNFMEVINEYRKTNMTFDELLSEYKPVQTYSSTTVLEESTVFSTVIELLAEEETKNNQNSVQKVGRNDPCPCGSGKKYKKCCMLKG